MMTREEKNAYAREYYRKNKEYRQKKKEQQKKYYDTLDKKERYQKNKEYYKIYQSENKDKIKEYYKKWYKIGGKEYQEDYYLDGHYSVYLLPNENYVGQTKKIKHRMYNHKYKGRDITGFKILHTFKTREEAKKKESEYHAMGYEG